MPTDRPRRECPYCHALIILTPGLLLLSLHYIRHPVRKWTPCPASLLAVSQAAERFES